jgi:DNA-binding transcriptional LysR family regulator
VANLDLNLLPALQALLEEGNVTRAAERLQMGQPAMSAALGRLRRHYHDELLVRVGREYRLTPFARTLLPGLYGAVRMLEDALNTAPEFEPEDSERVSRGVENSMILEAVPVQLSLADHHEPDARRLRRSPGVAGWPWQQDTRGRE